MALRIEIVEDKIPELPMEKTKKFKEQNLSTPVQLELFRWLPKDTENYSHTFELYDFIPMYEYGKTPRISGRFLESIEREFEWRGQRYVVRLTPGRIKDGKGKDRDMFLGKREELIVFALRKLAAENRAELVYLDGQFSVVFKISHLQELLRNSNHTYSLTELEESIRVLFAVQVEVRSADGKFVDNFHPVQAFGFRGKDDEEVTYVKFCSLITNSFENNTFRLTNFRTLMTFRTTIARLLHKRMSHVFTQADNLLVFKISARTIYRDFGLKLLNPAKMLARCEEAFEEMKTTSVIESVIIKPTFDRMSSRKKIPVDYVFEIKPHNEFVQEIIKANSDQKRRKNSVLFQNLKFNK